jgi:hypothetical protein
MARIAISSDLQDTRTAAEGIAALARAIHHRKEDPYAE